MLAGVSAGTAALFAIPARRWGGNGAYVVALLLLFFVLRTGVNLTAKPLLVDWWVISQVEKTFPVYALLLADDPELRRPVLVGMQRYLEDQDIDSPEWQLMQAKLTPPLMRQLSRAPRTSLSATQRCSQESSPTLRRPTWKVASGGCFLRFAALQSPSVPATWPI